MKRGWALMLAMVLCLSACAGWRLEPSHGTGAYDQGVNEGFGLEVSPYRTR